MISITKETFEELDYLKRKLELTGHNIKVLTTEIKNVQYKLSRHMERIMDNSNSILFLSSTIPCAPKPNQSYDFSKFTILNANKIF